jgi:hypothetical protein
MAITRVLFRVDHVVLFLYKLAWAVWLGSLKLEDKLQFRSNY